MNIKTLEKLLAQEESSSLEFKSSIDFGSKAGKAKFLKEMLSLANSTTDEPAYLIFGVEDKTKRLVGFEGATEEQLQQMVADNCKPPIIFSFNLVDYQEVPLGVVRIEPSETKPHTTKSKFGYVDPKSGKQKEISDTEVLIRRGSTIGIATTEEVIRMVQTRSGLTELVGKISGQLRQLGSSLEDIADILYTRDNEEFYNQLQSGDTPGSRRLVEGAFVGLLTSSFVSWQWGIEPLLIFPTCLLLCFTASVIKVVHYSALEILGYGFFISFVTGAIFQLGTWKDFLPTLMATSDSVGRTFIGACIGMVGGLMATAWVDRART